MAKKDKIVTANPLSDAERRRALNLFEDLLNGDTTENSWQAFFDKYPTILVEGLSLQRSCLHRQVPLLSGRPDYVFHRDIGDKPTGDFGVIELKRPDHSILGEYSAKHIFPSRHLAVAEKQATRYLQSIERGQFLDSKDFAIAGNRRYAFIIIGSSSEITAKCQTEVLKAQFRNLLPPGFYLYTYDELFSLFAQGTAPVIQVLFASDVTSQPTEVTLTIDVTNRYGLVGGPSALVSEAAQRFRSDIKIVKEGDKRIFMANGKSVLDILCLAAEQGSTLRITCTGPDALDQSRCVGDTISSLKRRVYDL